MEVCRAMVETGNPNSITDAGVGALAARSGVKGAFLNVKINVKDLEDKAFVEKILTAGKEIEQKTEALEAEILAKVNTEIGL
jgi:glutamate formiminotransferase/formiminotetrahydrofolate cyclodeaminase